MQHVDAYLASSVWTRPVSHNGQVSIGRHKYQVGCIHSDETVSVRFVPGLRVFCFQASDGSWSVELPAMGLEKPDITDLTPP